MSLEVLAPVAGRVLALADVADPVFAGEMVGAGLAVEPAPVDGVVEAVAPVAGRVVKLHPHAYVVMAPSGTGVLVHLGLDTVRLKGEGFDLLVAEGDDVVAGQPVVRQRAQVAREAGYALTCPVVVLDTPPGAVPADGAGREVAAGDVLFSWGG
ncbi:PTS sugar transporter subunit IIA [Vallicoccus soli]|uniref:PTS glucose transporter subunit IIA n=1 Tax=Vallicoccus soli TaxID=2339232 RepID=A0A3A3YXI1_9ACTN|nr:PTS glucose transporter subunit IIA [Vallicoccus soli]RJK96358.1 PTS glucose transporter subunit IIA [Vallicoccus soli]